MTFTILSVMTIQSVSGASAVSEAQLPRIAPIRQDRQDEDGLCRLRRGWDAVHPPSRRMHSMQPTYRQRGLDIVPSAAHQLAIHHPASG
ncbi:hypothetical protein BD414DRAFT_501601 [Trametes punicea]|nr:hypothetical protein BD414DRAFT_501601 [Trametes punicea]